MRNAFDNAAKFRTPKNMQTPTRTEKEAESEDTVKKNADSIRKVDDDEAQFIITQDVEADLMRELRKCLNECQMVYGDEFYDVLDVTHKEIASVQNMITNYEIADDVPLINLEDYGKDVQQFTANTVL